MILSIYLKIIGDGQMIIKPIPKEWGGPCKSEGGQICKVSVLKYFTKDHQYERFVYVVSPICLHTHNSRLDLNWKNN